MTIKKRISFLLLLLPLFSLAQPSPGDYPLLSLKADFCIPNSIQNVAFRGVTNGIVDINLGAKFSVNNFLHAGFGVDYKIFSLKPQTLRETNDASFDFVSPYLYVGTHAFISDKSFIELDCKVGYTDLRYSNSSINHKLSQNALKIEPQFKIYLISSIATTFGLKFSYAIIQERFSPESLGYSDLENFEDESFSNNYGIFSFGLTIDFDLRKKNDK